MIKKKLSFLLIFITLSVIAILDLTSTYLALTLHPMTLMETSALNSILFSYGTIGWVLDFFVQILIILIITVALYFSEVIMYNKIRESKNKKLARLAYKITVIAITIVFVYLALSRLIVVANNFSLIIQGFKLINIPGFT